jgi:PAS domain S-box-containing protein
MPNSKPSLTSDPGERSNPGSTARQQAEEAVVQSQKTFSELVERAPFGIYVVDSQFRIAQMNAGSQNGAFRNVRPVIGRDFAEAMRILWPEPVAAEIIAVFRHTLATGEPYYSPPFIKPRHDVETVEAYEWELHRLTLPDGQYGVVCYYFDSTNLREAEVALRRSEGRWNAAIENFGEGAIIATEAEQVIYWNPAARAMHGFSSAEEGIGPLKETPDTFQLWTPDAGRLLPLDEWPMRRVKRGETVRHLELRLRRPDQGWERIVSYSGAMVETAAGERLIFLSVYDLTEQRKAEAALARQREELQLILDSAPAMIFFKDRENHFLRVNRAFADSMGKPREQLEGRSLFELYPREQAEAFWKDDQEVLATGQPKANIIEPMQTRTGERWVHTAKIPCRDAQGNLAGVIGFALDITERKRAEEEIRRRAEELRATNEELTRFNEAMVGRELRMIELKQEVNALCAQLGQPPRYGSIADGQGLPTQ